MLQSQPMHLMSVDPLCPAIRTVSITETRICVENDLKLHCLMQSGHEVSGAVGDMSTRLPTRSAGQKISSNIV